MTEWMPYASPRPGESIAMTLYLTPQVRAYIAYYSPDGIWYASVEVGNRRVGGFKKAKSEVEAKARAIALTTEFVESVSSALNKLAGVTS